MGNEDKLLLCDTTVFFVIFGEKVPEVAISHMSYYRNWKDDFSKEKR
jgi:hypothetical protein